MNTLELASHGPVIPVIVIHELADAVPLARALVEGGVKVLEVTLRTPVALRCMEAIAAEVPGAIVGAGTIRSVADARDAKNAGCAFGVSPGYTSDVEYSPEDGSRSDVDFMCEVLQIAVDNGATTLNIPDTVGYGVPEEYAKLAVAIAENPMLNGQCLRLDAGQRFAPK